MDFRKRSATRCVRASNPRLGRSGKAVEDVFIICYTGDGNGYWPDDIFEKKLRAGDIVDDGQQYWSETHPGKTKWQMDDFDPAFGLEGEVSDSILDWERRTIERAAAKYPNLRIRYISPMGREEKAEDVFGLAFAKGAPAWYKGAGD